MPIYEYRCKKCGKEFEIIFTPDIYKKVAKVSCDQCEGECEQKISLSAFHLKGKGWSKAHEA